MWYLETYNYWLLFKGMVILTQEMLCKNVECVIINIEFEVI